MPAEVGRRYRWREGVRKGRWLPTNEEAWEAAAKAGAAHKDEHGRIFLNALTVIEEDPPRR